MGSIIFSIDLYILDRNFYRKVHSIFYLVIRSIDQSNNRSYDRIKENSRSFQILLRLINFCVTYNRSKTFYRNKFSIDPYDRSVPIRSKKRSKLGSDRNRIFNRSYFWTDRNWSLIVVTARKSTKPCKTYKFK